MQVVNHYCLRHYLKKISKLLFLKYYTVRKPYISDKLWRELRQYIYNPVMFPGEDNGIIYIRTKDTFCCVLCLARRRFLGKRVFLGG